MNSYQLQSLYYITCTHSEQWYCVTFITQDHSKIPHHTASWQGDIEKYYMQAR